MKNKETQVIHITHPEIEKYAEEMTTSESETIKELVQSSDEALDFIDMLSGNLAGQLLKMLIKISGAKRILEIGTFTGYSALTMAEALPDDGEIITMEMNLLYQDLSQKHFERYDHGHKIKLLKGNASDLLKEVNGEFDLVFLDADKLRYEYYYGQIIPKIRSGGILVVDNVLWDGMVLKPQDPKSEAIDAFNKRVAEDPGVEQVLLPVRDGLFLVRKK